MALDILKQKLHNQLLSQTKFNQPSQVVAWLGAVQSQDYAGGKWAIAQRTKGLTDAAIEQAFTKGEILVRMSCVPPGILSHPRIFAGCSH